MTTYDPELLYKELERQLKDGLAAKSAEESDEVERARAEAAAVEKMIAKAAAEAKGETEKAERRFFAVLTIGKGEAPKVLIEETPEGVTATVGGRVVRWDGRKMTLATAEAGEPAQGAAPAGAASEKSK